MKYPVVRKPEYDFTGQSYASVYPNLHRYPATMIPQIGIKILQELGVSGRKLLDPYCGSGTSFAVGLDCGFTEMHGFDLNPLAVLISRAKFTKLDIDSLESTAQWLRQSVDQLASSNAIDAAALPIPKVYNIHYWFSDDVIQKLAILKYFLDQIDDESIKQFCLIAFSETVRECSYTRNHEFKLFRIKPEAIPTFKPDVFATYFVKLTMSMGIYKQYYLPKLDRAKIQIHCQAFESVSKKAKSVYDVVLTSPPYGDSKTTVGYGQFSTLANEWLGIPYARKVDTMLMGGQHVTELYDQGVIAPFVDRIAQSSHTRALQVSAFYHDLGTSIDAVAPNMKSGGQVVYVVGNRRVKAIQLPTDQFVAERFEQCGFSHHVTYERLLGNKSMPWKNAPTNKKHQQASTMTCEYIVICEKV